MNRPVTKLLLKILLGFWVMEPIPNKMRRRRRRRTTMWDEILRRGRLFGCHRRNSTEKRQKHTRTLAQERRKEKNTAWKCMSMLRAKRKALLGHMCFSCYRTYVMILCNWLIFWQNALYLYLGRLKMCLNTLRNHISRSSVEAFKYVQEIKKECKFSKARQLVDSCSTPPICRGLRISEFNSDFLGIRESVYGPSFLLTLDI